MSYGGSHRLLSPPYPERVEEASVVHHFGIDVKELHHTNSSCLADVWVLILQPYVMEGCVHVEELK